MLSSKMFPGYVRTRKLENHSFNESFVWGGFNLRTYVLIVHIMCLAVGSVTFLIRSMKIRTMDRACSPILCPQFQVNRKYFITAREMREMCSNNLCNYKIFLKTLLQCVLDVKILTYSQNCETIKNDGKNSDWKLIIAKNLEVVY